MLTIPGLIQLAPQLDGMDLKAPATIGRGVPLRVPKLGPPISAPPLIRQADMRPHTMKVKGKSLAESIIVSRDPGVPCTSSMRPMFGRFRNEPRGMYYKENPANNIETPLMPRPDSAYGFLTTKLKQP